MAVLGLAKIINEYGLRVQGDVAYGLLKGCFVTLSEGDGYKRLCIYTGPRGSGSAENAESFLRRQDLKQYRLRKDRGSRPGLASDPEGVVTLHFSAVLGVEGRMRAFIEEILPQIAPLTATQLCQHCGQPITGEDLSLVALDGGSIVPMHNHCQAEHAAIQQQEWDRAVAESNVLTGIIGAVIGAALGAILWMIVGKLGYISALVGLAIAFFASFGYDKLKGRPGKIKVITLIVCVILAVFLGTFGTIVWEVHDIYVEETANSVVLRQMLPESTFMAQVLPELMREPEVFGEFMKDAVLGLVFSFLGSFGLLYRSGHQIGNRKRG